jgi:hypothetical protein
LIQKPVHGEKIYESKNDQAFIVATELDYSSFQQLLSKFQPDCLGLLLMWTKTKGSMFSFQMKFGVLSNTTATSLYLQFAHRILLHIFNKDGDAPIYINNQKIEEYKAATKRRHPIFEDIWCTMDGTFI